MPRTARTLSESGIYHVMLRGINREKIFRDEEDFRVFLGVLAKFKSISQYELFSYCLMENHVHLLIRPNTETLDKVFRRIGASFVYWYNMKYDRVGHLFQDRFRSEPVETDAYFLGALRYILRNPVKAGLCVSPEEYPYSSAKEYILGQSGISDTSIAMELVDRDALITFFHEKNQDEFLEDTEKRRTGITDTVASTRIDAKLGNGLFSENSSTARMNLYYAILELLDGGISIRQLSRLSGIPKSTIEKALKQR